MQRAVEGAGVLVVAIPSQFLAPVLREAKQFLQPNTVVVSVVKSLHAEQGSLSLPSQVREPAQPINGSHTSAAHRKSHNCLAATVNASFFVDQTYTERC